MNLDVTAAELASLMGGRLSSGDPAARVRSLAIDSRALQEGDYFVALAGERSDGHEFVPEVLARGAAGVVVSRDVPGIPQGTNCIRVAAAIPALQKAGQAFRRRFPVRVVGITGSNGKTTTKDMTAHALAAGGKKVLATRGNLNSQIGLPLMLMEIEAGMSHAVLEMGASERGNIRRLAELAGPDTGVITGIGAAHLEYFGSLEGVRDAKWELIESLPHGGVAVLNADDPLLASKAVPAGRRSVTFGFGAGADVRGENVAQDESVTFDLLCDGKRLPVRLPLPGLFNVRNALAAAAVAWTEGIGLDAICASLAAFSPPKMRMEVRRLPDGTVFLIDAYNANPTSMKASIESFVRAFPGRPHVAVLGSMLELGPSAQAEHTALGALVAGSAVDEVYFLGPEGGWVRYGAGPAKERVRLFDDHDSLRRALAAALRPGSAVLFKASRGVKLEKIFEPMIESRPGGNS